MILRDKTLFYQHNLAPETFTFDKETLLWNLAMGYMLSYDLNLSRYGGGLDSPWLDVVHLFQKEVQAEYADELVTDYFHLQNDVTKTVFGTFEVITNWDSSQPYDTGTHILPPNGTYVISNDGRVSAGIFTRYNRVLLSSGEHFIIEKRDEARIRVWQPLGADTNIKLIALPSWTNGDTLLVSAYDKTGQTIAVAFENVENNAIILNYLSDINGRTVEYYELTGPITLSAVYLPLILK